MPKAHSFVARASHHELDVKRHNSYLTASVALNSCSSAIR
jgi:hypothetical protein